MAVRRPRINEKLAEKIEAEQLPHENSFQETMARLMSKAGVDLEA